MQKQKRFIGVFDYTVILTYAGLFSALIGLTGAVRGKFTMGILCLFVAGVCDAFDGIVARAKKNRTPEEKAFGIQLDSLCDVISFGAYPAFLCYFMGMDGLSGIAAACFYCFCAVDRLAFFNVLEDLRQKQEDGCAKTYRGLPVTSISLILPVVYLLRFLVGEGQFALILHLLLIGMGLLFILDFTVPKPDWKRILTGK